MGIAREKLKS